MVHGSEVSAFASIERIYSVSEKYILIKTYEHLIP
jgi:hypothetical protein